MAGSTDPWARSVKRAITDPMSEALHDARPGRFWSRRGPDGPWDYVVIGSGMGGMTAAAFLSKLGRRVLVLEQHYEPGGFTHTFRRKGWVWDVGVHAVGEVTTHTLTGRLLERLTDGRLQWASLGPVYDAFQFPDDLRIDFPDTPIGFRDNLVAAFPAEEAGIDAYLDEVRNVAGTMRSYYLGRALPNRLSPVERWLVKKAQRYLLENTEEAIARFTSDERLKTVLVSQWGYYGSLPSRSSFAMQALVTKHFLHGGFYPVGGSKSIALGLLGTVAKAGGWTRIKADVERLLVERGRVVGVRLADGEQIRAKKVVSAAGILSTVQRLLPDAEVSAPWASSVQTLRPASAHVCLYMGFKGDIRAAAGAGSENRWFYETWKREQESWEVSPEGPLPRAPVLYTSFPSLKDPEHDPGPEQLHTGEVVTFVPWSVFEPWVKSPWKKRGPEYEAFKQKMQDALLKQIFERMPGLEPHLEWAELSTPVSTEHFCRPVSGSIYGLEPTPERFENPWLRPRAPIDGLYFAGSEVTTVGVMGAMMGGVLATLAAEPVRAMKVLAEVQRGRRSG